MRKFIPLVIALGVAGLLTLGKRGSGDAPDQPKPAATGEHWYEPGDEGTVTPTALGCLSKEDVADFLQLVAIDKDEEAARVFAQRKVLAGSCRVLPSGTRVVFKSLAFLSDAVCVRPVGEPSCFWVNKARLKWNESAPAQVQEGKP